MDLSSSFVKVPGYTSREDVLTDMNVSRANAITNLLTSPQQFASSLYVRSGLILKTTSSLAFPVDGDLCFLAQDQPNKSWVDKKLLGVQGAVGVPSLLYLGPYNDRQVYILKEAPYSNLFIRIASKPPPPLPNSSICSFAQSEELIPIQCDEFTNETLIGFVLNHYLDVLEAKCRVINQPTVTLSESIKEELMKYAYGVYLSQIITSYHPVVRYYGGFVCRDRSYILMEYCDMGALDSFVEQSSQGRATLPGPSPTLISTISYLKEHRLVPITIVRPEYTVQIVKQVVAAIVTLQSLASFISGDLKVANVFVASRPLSVTVNGLTLSSPFTCKIADYGKSSLTLDPNIWSPASTMDNRVINSPRYRLYNYNSAASATFSLTTPPTFGRTPDGTSYYVIPKALVASGITPLAYIRHAGYPFYRSIDLYTMIVSMMLIPAFYYSVMTQPQLRSVLWDSLWFQDELDSITREVHRKKGISASYRTVVPLLLGRKLKCNAVDDYFELLKTI